MPVNYPGPYEIEYNLTGWTSPARTHVHRVNVIALGSPAPGTLATAIDIQKMGGATAKLNVVANQYWEFIRLIYPNTISCVGYTLWKYIPGTHAKDFIAAGTLTNVAGSNVSAIVIAWQDVLSFRSANGGILKLQYMESSLSGETRGVLIPSAVGQPAQRIAAYIMSADNIALARDDSFPVTALRDSRGQNERIWREIYR